jgi:hypothetical protein
MAGIIWDCWRLPLSLLLCAACCSVAMAALRDAAAHVHGHGDLAVTVDGDTLTVRFESPVFTLVGFEHPPASAAELTAWSEVLQHFRASDQRMFRPSDNARCSVVGTAIQDPFAAHADHDGTAPADHDDRGAEISEMHTHEHDDHDAAVHDEHYELVVQYRFDCARMDRLRAIDVGLFGVFDGLAVLNAVYLDQERQYGATLSATRARLRWR